MNDNNETKTLGKVIHIDETQIQDFLGELVRGIVEETLNAMLDAEADAICGAQCYERSPDRIDTRAGHYNRKFHTKAGEVDLKMTKLRPQTFETAIIERYKRRETPIEEALLDIYLASVSIRRVEDITEALWGTRVSSDTVSNRNKKIYKHIETSVAAPSKAIILRFTSIASSSSVAGPARFKMFPCCWRLVSIRTAFVVFSAFRKATRKISLAGADSSAISKSGALLAFV